MSVQNQGRSRSRVVLSCRSVGKCCLVKLRGEGMGLYIPFVASSYDCYGLPLLADVLLQWLKHDPHTLRSRR
jgi:hypothetical protein